MATDFKIFILAFYEFCIQLDKLVLFQVGGLVWFLKEYFLVSKK